MAKNEETKKEAAGGRGKTRLRPAPSKKSEDSGATDTVTTLAGGRGKSR